MLMFRTWMYCLLCALLSTFSSHAQAQQGLEIVATADIGSALSGLTVDGSGNLYAVLARGEAKNLGSVIVASPDGRVRVLHAFSGPEGARPMAALTVGPDGALYGTTASGGEHGYGTAFRITSSGELRVLHHFSVEDGGASRVPLLLAADGSLIGVTSGVYTHGCARSCVFSLTSLGRIFKLTPAGKLSVLYEGILAPGGGLMQASNGDFYGVKSRLANAEGLTSKQAAGSVYRLGLDGSMSFGPASKDPLFDPSGELVEAEDGFLYGMNDESDTAEDSTPGVFRLTITANPADTTLSQISKVNVLPGGLAIGSDKNFYGGATGLTRLTAKGQTTALGAFGCAATTALRADGRGGFFVGCRDRIMRVTQAGVATELHRFGYQDGERLDSVLLVRDGSLFGTTERGGDFDYGTLFHVDQRGELETLYHFPVGTGLYGSLVEGPAGTVYALTAEAIPRIVRAEAGKPGLTTLYAFEPTGRNASQLVRSLALGADGALYGTTTAPQPDPARSPRVELYRFDLQSKTRRVLGTFDGISPLLRAANGDIYGVRTIHHNGLVKPALFRVRGGRLTDLQYFATDPKGHAPDYNLSEGIDGSIYGFAHGRAESTSFIYRWTPADRLQIHYVFPSDSTVDKSPLALEVGPSGEIYLMTPGFWWPEHETKTFVLRPDGSLSQLPQRAYWNVKAPDGSVYSVVPTTRDGYSGARLEQLLLP
jgi:uncharacterized repeat protein (TIGR03803 family)